MRTVGRVPLMAAVAVVVAASATPSSASDAIGTVSDTGIGVAWEGAAPPLVDDAHELTIDLPLGVWEDGGGGVQIGVRWDSEDHDLDLKVTGPDGAVHDSTGFPSTAESVLVPNAANGVYLVEVTSQTTDTVAYEAFAQVERDVAAEPMRDLLPDLVSLEPRNTNLALGAYLLNPTGGIDLASCYPEEQAEQGARTCLRFDQIIANVGDGPFELRYTVPPTGASPSGTLNLVRFEDLRQRVHRSDGTWQDRHADTYELHPAHAHFHYSNFAVSSLWSVDGQAVRSGRKNGFCMVDVENHWFGEKGDAARSYVPPACLAPTAEQGGEMVNGISVGWADVYNWYLADQFIEVSGLADGRYVLKTVADPASTIVELDDDNNCSAVLIELSAGLTEAEIVGPAEC